MNYHWYDFVGNVGVASVLLTYLLVQLGRMSPNTVIYTSVNALGAVLIIVSLTQTFNLSSFIIEICWLTISLVGLCRVLILRARAPGRE